MGAYFILENILQLPGIKIFEPRSNILFSFEYVQADGIKNNYTVYVPTRDDYEISMEVVNRAFEMGASIIVYDTWIKPTGSGNAYAASKNIKIFTWKDFVDKVRNGCKL